ISVTGTAFNGNSFSASGSSDGNGEWSIGPLPPGSFQALATSANRTCGGYSTTTVAPGSSAGAGSASCVDALAPGPLVLGIPIPSGGAQPGYTSATTVTVPVVTQATDPTAPASNFRGYQLAIGASPDWSSATLIPGHTSSLSFTGLPANARTLLSARAVDWVGNAGPAAAVEVIHDDVPPPAPQLSTPRPIVDATTTSVTASGSESDVNFLGYEQCTGSVAAGAACPVSAGCAFAGVARTFAVSLAEEAKTCVYARAIDKAGNASGAMLAEIVSDLTPPSPPQFVPSYDPTSVSVRAPWVDFFVAAAATDEPAGGRAPWRNVAFIEVDTGGGFAPLCAQPACHSSGTYSPCTCGCADSRLLCNGPQFVGVRAPLTEGTSTTVAFRALDLAGNVGAGIAQQVHADATGDIIGATSGSEGMPRLNGTLLTFLRG
ncbi:MAG TPA: hypothetical protein VKJ07_08220, partial [Mycobacteriales bacterium]|nr:hypothetical protein [Mycobacteriales bacterium]